MLEHGFEVIGGFPFGDEYGRVVSREVRCHEPGLLLIRQFGQRAGDFIHPGLLEDERQEVRVGEIAIVVRLLLRAHGSRFAVAGIEQPRFLADRAARLDDVDLTARFVLDR